MVSGESRQQVQRYLYNGPPRMDIMQQNLVYLSIQLTTRETPCTNAANHVKNWEYSWLSKKCITHEVVAVDRANNYAIIQHNRYQTSVCEVCFLAPISLSCLNPDQIDYVPNYFLCGINNDDELYFLHAPSQLLNITSITHVVIC